MSESDFFKKKGIRSLEKKTLVILVEFIQKKKKLICNSSIAKVLSDSGVIVAGWLMWLADYFHTQKPDASHLMSDSRMPTNSHLWFSPKISGGACVFLFCGALEFVSNNTTL